ncbi:nucleoside-diphosphate kinase [Alkalibacterium sp. 20]|uniref:nucleoside-diphosphate kinase n=1 Tax=Alkalibacterium sp. 20 TaxID=1798803 RepID=UPI00090018DF|nr:nucleoside-diphosphate kinase [Alkalibacterium sp. 20]OJF94029.1 nucleoside-diphosphate kinase [Alkalibacterium sp. 20]
MQERTLVLIKPDAIERNLIGAIISEYERNELNVIEMKMVTASKSTAKKHYAEHEGRSFYPNLIEYLTCGPLVALIVEGENAITRIRALNGSTDPQKADDKTIRALYGLSKPKNTVHSSDSKESAEREIEIWFG